MHSESIRYFVSYTGIKLPFRLVNELDAAQVENRNTYFRGTFDAQGRLTGFDKFAYGEIELRHRYTYRESGTLEHAEIIDIEGDSTHLDFDSEGKPA